MSAKNQEAQVVGTTDQPISKIEWLPVDLIEANDWNPNVVITPEFRLLRTSLLRQGWIQPLLLSRETREDGSTRYVLIDGFHRCTIAKTDDTVREMTGGLVPCAVLDLPLYERMMVTLRINRAKGSHVALKMHALVTSLVKEQGIPVAEVARGIGASEHEVNTLLVENLFGRLDVDGRPYSKAWVPRTKGKEQAPATILGETEAVEGKPDAPAPSADPGLPSTEIGDEVRAG